MAKGRARSNYVMRTWTLEEMVLLRESRRKGVSYQALSRRLRRSPQACSSKFHKMMSGRAWVPHETLPAERPWRGWTEEESAILRENAERGVKWLAERLGRTENGVRVKASALGQSVKCAEGRKGRGRLWSEEDVQTLRVEAWRGTKGVARILGRGPTAIRTKAAYLGIPLGQPERQWTEEELTTLREEGRMLGQAELAKRLNRTENAVRKRAHMIGVSIRKV